MSSSFNRLAPFLQEYIYTHNWTELRQVQIEACRVILDTNAHLLLAAGTASGKTEAAFLPILTSLYENPTATVGVLYISPIKALINDQFTRLNNLVQQTHTEVYAWHGDTSASRKRKLLKHPQGILQITPESLESLLINQHGELKRLFGDLSFVVIDEIHAFMGSQRGEQILCQLGRLSNYVRQPPRRLGLSATLGDYSLAKQWLQSGTQIPVIAPEIDSGNRTVRLSLEHFWRAEEKEVKQPRKNNFSSTTVKFHHPSPLPYHKYLFDLSKARKCLIFANNRTETESVIANLRQIAQAEGEPDIYHVHHGSISAHLRELAEIAMREDNPAVTAATVTLEMGIDLGQLERVIQLNAPYSVASFLQRLGRTGRRGKPADMRFICTETELLGEELLPERLPWQLLQAIAIIQLYLEERWIEPLQLQKYPFSLLYHQTMSILAARGELSPAALAQAVLTLPTFRHISQPDYQQLLRYLLSIEHLQQTQGKLMLGLAGEKIARNFRFYAVFADNEEYTVRSESGTIGSIALPLAPGKRFTLAGKTWQVTEIDAQRKSLFVQEVEGLANTSWRGGSVSIHSKILSRMRQVLVEDTEYSYLQPQAKKRLQQARQLAKIEGLATEHLIPLDEKTCCFFPWLGTLAFNTLERYLNVCVRESLNIRGISGKSPYFLTVKLPQKQFSQLHEEIVSFQQKSLTAEDLIDSVEAPKIHKYDQFIPDNLLRKAFAADHLDVEELKSELSKW